MDEFKGRPISTTSYTDIDETPRSGRRADTADLAEFFKNTAPPPVARKPIAEPVEDPAPAYSHRRRNLPRRTLLILIAVVGACLLALIIGLAVGLTRNHHKNLPLPTTHGGPFTGDLTYYFPALGACGVSSTSSDHIVSVSHTIFDASSKSSNPNDNPLCGLKIRATRDGKSIDLKVVDRCTGCESTDLDVSEGAFKQLADPDSGRVKVQWAWLETAPGTAGGNTTEA